MKALKQIFDKYNNFSTLTKASLWFLFCSFVQKGISVISTPIFTRLLTPEEFGSFSVFNSWLGIATAIVTLNLFGGVYIQGLVKFGKISRQFSSNLQCLNLTLVIFWTCIYFIFESFWNDLLSLTTCQITLMLVLIWTSSVYNFWSSEQRVYCHYRSLVFVSLLVAILKPILGILFVIYSNDKVTARILSLVVVELAIFSFLFFKQVLHGKSFFSISIWKYALAFNIPLVPHYLSSSLLQTVDRIMIGSMIGSREAGIFSLGYSIAFLMTLFTNSLFQTLEPWLYKKIKERRISDIKTVAYPVFAFIILLNLLLILAVPEIVYIFAPESYYEAVWVIPPIAISTFFMFTYTFFAAFEFYFEKTKFITVATLSGALLKVVLNYFFLEGFGYQFASYSTLLCFVTFALMHYLFMRKICAENFGNVQPYESKPLFLMSLILIVLGLVLMWTYQYKEVRYIFLTLTLLMIFLKRKYLISMFKSWLFLKNE